MYVPHKCVGLWGAEEASGSLELEFQVVVSCPALVLATEPLEEQEILLTAERRLQLCPSPPHICLPEMGLWLSCKCCVLGLWQHSARCFRIQ